MGTTMVDRVSSALLVLACTALFGCKPTVGQAPSLITDPTLLAVMGSPAEARPGATITYSFVLASPQGPVLDAEALWSLCETPKPPSESNSVSSACTGAPDAGVEATGQTFAAAIPTKACQLFGPIAPPPVVGQPAIRPRDPDSTGGFYLPVQVWLPSQPNGPLSGFAFERITCNLANAPSAIIAEYGSRYQANLDPDIDHAELIDAVGVQQSLDLGGASVVAGAEYTVEATFAAGAAESFPVYDPQAETLVEQAESLHLSWYVTAGAFEHDRTGVAAGEAATASHNRWTAPSEPGTVFVWLVLRDSRGGTSYKTYQVVVAG
jgi:hypothetical protein